MQKIPSFLVLIIITLILITLASLNSWVLPIRNFPQNHHYNVGDQVPFFAHKVGPLDNPSEAYEYYDLPFCPPDQLIGRKESLGQVLNGNRLTNTRYNIKFQEMKTTEILCRKTLKKEDIVKFRDAIQSDFYYQMYYDDLPFWGYIGKNEGESLSPSGKGPSSYIFTHVQFDLLYSDNHVIEVHAFSDPNHAVDITEDAEIDVQFTYSTNWNVTSAEFATRMNRYSRTSLLSPIQQLHWFSLINSAVIFMLSVGLLVVLYWWNTNGGLRKYSPRDEDGNEVGWATSDGDIFRRPTYLPLFCAVIGCGTQIFLVLCCLFGSIYFGIIEPYDQGTLWTAVLVMYTLTSPIAGYTSASYHCKFAENGWEKSVCLSGIIFTGPLLLVMFILNIVATLYGATATSPFGTTIEMFLIYTFITVPLLALGGVIRQRYSYRIPLTSTKSLSRDVPSSTWYRKIQGQMLLGGLLPFSGILVELHLCSASLWSHKLFTQSSVLIINFSIFICLTAVLSIGLTYIQLSGEDPWWWWRSVLQGGSTAILMFLYCIYFYTRSQMSGFMQLSYFLGYNACICYAFFLMLGAISFHASLMFISRIYHAVKRE